MRLLNYCNIDVIDYKEAWELQKEVLDARHQNKIEDTLFLLEHNNTYTLGKIADKKNLICSEEFLRNNNISVYDIDRGGDITYHGPGQIVGYPIINLNNWKNDTHKYLRALEEVLVLTCAQYGLKAERNCKYTGVWIGNRKIAAIGIKVKRWITMHGFAFNVNPDLALFNGIIPCGINDKEVTSLNKELSNKTNISEVKENILSNFKKVFEYDKIKNINLNEISLSEMNYTTN
ncbi:MAG: lipoyl(octanoyl) transferase [Ignavibacteriales bacterium CG_4_9_14_3_um_filter_30_11]|nr:MAG: lipoyl(octanoyl) transferase [Ignavibacteriales bacterium CG_4_9_14_3_um_filter_30_11]